ncbi:MAG: lysostaphin resistance A-like protein [Actinomycetota bacterium]
MESTPCAFHPGEKAVATCEACGRHLCGRCLRLQEGCRVCPACAEVDAIAAGVMADRRDAALPQGGGPVAARVVVTCAFHPGARAVTRCSRCGAFICSACQRARGDKRFCGNCFQEMAYGRRAEASGGRGAMELAPPSGAGWKLWPGLAFLPLPFLLSGLMTYMMRQGEEVSVGAAQLFLSILLYSSTLAFAFLVVSRYGDAAGQLGMKGDRLLPGLGLGIICGSLAFWMMAAGGFISKGLFGRLGWVEEWLRSFFDVNVKSVTGPDLLVACLVIVIAAPVCEEIFFRGFLYPAMRRRMGVWSAALLNGFLFSAVHFSLFGLLGRTVVGALFCLLYEYTGNLWSPVVAHGINNFVAFLLPLAAMWG